jgi:hypothetical protein
VADDDAVGTWAITVDCVDPDLVGRFWAVALGYVAAPAPTGWATWELWFDHFGVPVEERTLLGALVDPTGAGPALSFLAVPEPKTVKNRLHVDLRVGGGRQVEFERRWPRVLAEVDRLTAAGATVIEQVDFDGRGDHVVMADPEGNDFCVV